MMHQKERSSNPALFITSQASQCSRKERFLNELTGVQIGRITRDLTAAYVNVSTLQAEFLSLCCEICCLSSAGMWKFGFQENCYFSFTGGTNRQKFGNKRWRLEGYLWQKVLLKAEFNPAVEQALARTMVMLNHPLTHRASLSLISWWWFGAQKGQVLSCFAVRSF